MQIFFKHFGAFPATYRMMKIASFPEIVFN